MNKDERHGKSLLVPKSTFWEVYPAFSIWSYILDHSLLFHSKFWIDFLKLEFYQIDFTVQAGYAKNWLLILIEGENFPPVDI